MTPANARKILGVPSNAEPQELRRAFRELCGKYHPDKVSHLGQEFQDLAHQRFLEISAAYNLLLKD